MLYSHRFAQKGSILFLSEKRRFVVTDYCFTLQWIFPVKTLEPVVALAFSFLDRC